jgi:hypothetical protein
MVHDTNSIKEGIKRNVSDVSACRTAIGREGTIMRQEDIQKS